MAATLKALLHARLNIGLPNRRGRLHPSGVRAYFHHARRFLGFVGARVGRCDLARVDQRLLDAYLARLQSGSGRSPSNVTHAVEPVIDFHLYRDHLPAGGIAVAPWQGRAATRVAGASRPKNRENLTPRIPEAVIGPLLAWSLKYVAAFAPDILQARAELAGLEARCAELAARDEGLPRGQLRRRRLDRMMQFLAERRRHGRGVPIWTPRAGDAGPGQDPGAPVPVINTHLLRLHAGVGQKGKGYGALLQRGFRREILAAIAADSIEVGGMDTPISADPDTGRPWRPRFDARTLAHEERMLQAACYVVYAYLTGMRDSEVQAMRAGCHTVTRSADGSIERHRVRSTVYKGRRAEGEAADWITIRPVADAIGVIEALTGPVRRARGDEALWRVLGVFGRNGHLCTGIVRNLNAFRDHLNARFGRDGAAVVPLGPDGEPWRFNTLQFRRTVAWYIGNRPFGVVAGKIQYKHASAAAFEGYAGSSPSGFRREVERERALGQLDDVLAYFDRHRRGAGPSGPAGPRVARELDRVAAELDPFPGHVANPARLRAMLSGLARTLHAGVLADCFFDPATALCLRAAERAGAVGPVTALCQPTRCANACTAARHRPVWAGALADAEALLRTKRLSEHQRVVLRGEAERFRGVLEGIPVED